MNTSSSPLLEELASIAAYLAAAQAILKDGNMPDMSTLEQRISDVCMNIQAAEFEEQGQCLPQLALLLKSLDDCERGIRAWKEAQKMAGTS